MAVASHLERRGAVYYWRRRLPDFLAERLKQRCVVVSLRTRELKPARYLAAQLDAAVEKMLVSSSVHWVTKEQLKDFFRRAFATHEEIIRRAAGISGGPSGLDSDRTLSVIQGWTFKIIAEQGTPAEVREEDRLAMASAGVSPADLATVVDAVRWHCSAERLSHMWQAIAKILAEVGAEPTSDNIMRAERLYARAQSEAAFKILPAETPEFDFGALVQEAQAAPPSIAWSVTEPARKPGNGVGQRGTSIPRATAVQHLGEYFGPSIVSSPAAEAAGRTKAVPVMDLAGGLARDKEKRGEWTAKTKSQFLSICSLFDRFVREECSVDDLRHLEQSHLYAFDQFLLHTIGKSYGKSPSDLEASIADLKRKAAGLPAALRGLATGTLERHYTFLDQLLAQARLKGAKIAEDLKFADFKPKGSGRARDERPIPDQTMIEPLFQQPVYQGCRSWDAPFEQGNDIYHRAAYFGPLFAYYQGMRREEFCGLMAADIMTVTKSGDHIAHIRVLDNDVRRLKNPQSRRFLPLHPELQRLGLIEYSQRIRDLGYDLLFPELRSPSSRSPLGDRYYDEWSKAKLPGRTAHPLRHAFNDELKQQRVSDEMRADMMGHGGKTETTERYANAFRLQTQAEDMQKIPILTSMIAPQPIRIVPWVAKRQDAPWARKSRKKSSGMTEVI